MDAVCFSLAIMVTMNTIEKSQVAQAFMKGMVGVIPTDTVYGLAARAHDESAVKKMYDLKNREKKPGTLIAANVQQLLDLGVSQGDIDQVSKYWPGPVSAVLTLYTSGYLHQEVGTLAMRVVDDENLVKILETTGPLITSSANQPAQPPATTIDEAYDYFGDSVDFYVDGGVIDNVQPSTIVRPTTDGLEILRQGAVEISN